MRATKFALVVLFALSFGTPPLFPQDFPRDIRLLDNFRLEHDGSEELLRSKEIPERVSRLLDRSVGAALLVKRNTFCLSNFLKLFRRPCYYVVASTTAFVIDDHRALTNFHLVEGRAKGNGRPNILVKEERKRGEFFIEVLFDGKLYEADLVNRERVDGVDLLVMDVRDPDRTFNAPPIPRRSRELPAGIQKLYTVGFYGGCDNKPALDAIRPYCLTPGVLIFYVFKGRIYDEYFHAELGSMVGLIANGFSGCPLVDENGELALICKGISYEHFRSYFIDPSNMEYIFSMRKGEGRAPDEADASLRSARRGRKNE